MGPAVKAHETSRSTQSLKQLDFQFQNQIRPNQDIYLTYYLYALHYKIPDAWDTGRLWEILVYVQCIAFLPPTYISWISMEISQPGLWPRPYLMRTTRKNILRLYWQVWHRFTEKHRQLNWIWWATALLYPQYRRTYHIYAESKLNHIWDLSSMFKKQLN